MQSIVMSMSVCVCLSVRENIYGTTRTVFAIFASIAYGRGSVLLRQGDYDELGPAAPFQGYPEKCKMQF